MSIARACLLLLLAGCASSRNWQTPTTQIGDNPASIGVAMSPPIGWRQAEPERSANHIRLVWVSPTSATAVGVIRFQMPLAVGYEWALWGFLQRMKSAEGRAELIQKNYDPDGTLRFVAEGGRYRVRVRMIVQGTDGWAIFAGTKTDLSINPIELSAAEQSRDSASILQNSLRP